MDVEIFVPGIHDWIDQTLYDKYKAEFYGSLCALRIGEAKNAIKSVLDIPGDLNLSGDGYKALAMLNERFDANTSASLLQLLGDVAKPPPIKNTSEITPGTHRWEAKVTGLQSHSNKNLDE